MDAAQPSEPATARSDATPIGQFDCPGISDHDVLDIPSSIRENADLSSDVVADLGQLPSELVAHQAVGGEPTLEETLELADLAGLEAAGIAEDLNGRLQNQRNAR